MDEASVGEEAHAARRSLSHLNRAVHHSPGTAEHSLISICAILEVYVDSSLQGLIKASGVAQQRFGQAMLTHLEDQFNQSWTARLRWLASGFGISLAGTEVDGDRATLVEARNAIVHGGGKLTARQTRSVGDALDLQRRLRDRMNAELVGHSLVLNELAIRWSLEVARAYVDALEPLVQRELYSLTD